MSRLDSFIRRLMAQRACLNASRELIRHLPGPILELGLGNGRTYDHLRELFPDRDIFVFERQPAAHPQSFPDHSRLVVGDIRETLPRASGWLPRPAALVHSDLGNSDPVRTTALAGWLSEVVPPLTAPGGIVISDQPLTNVHLASQPLPDSLPAGRYFFYRRHG